MKFYSMYVKYNLDPLNFECYIKTYYIIILYYSYDNEQNSTINFMNFHETLKFKTHKIFTKSNFFKVYHVNDLAIV